MNEFDLQDIKNITKRKIAVSNFQTSNNMEKDRKSKIIFLTRTLTSISACLIFFCGIIYSNKISTNIYNYAISLKVEKTTVNNGSTANFSGEYSISDEEIIDLENNNQGISQDNLKVKVEDVTMDDNNLEVKFDVELSEEISKKLNNKEGVEIEFEDLLITDENNNILVGLDEDRYSIRSYVLKYNGKNAKVVYIKNLVGQDKYYPRCQSLNFAIGNIKILNDMESDYGGIILNYKGKWNFSINLPENIINRKRTTYKMIEKEDLEENIVKYFNVLSSGTEIKLRLKAPETVKSDTSPQLNLINALEIESPSIQIRDYFVDELMASEEYKKYEKDLRKTYIIQDAYIEDNNGKKYAKKNGVYSNFGGNITDDGFYEPALVLEFNEKNIIDKVKLHITYCDAEYVFELVKEGEI